MKDLVQRILASPVTEFKSVTGGDISEAYFVQTAKEAFFLKYHKGEKGYALFQAEISGLQAIRETNTIATPEIIACHNLGDAAMLLMEYIPTQNANRSSMKLFGEQLAQMHLCSANTFGANQDNFIGSLTQQNAFSSDWTSFYIKQRLLPQLQMAQKQKFLQTKDIPTIEQMENVCQPLFAHIKPSCLHGDLWSGNYLIRTDGTPYLIDPAQYNGHSEVDIAMTHLFGGFSTEFYEAYHHIIPLDRNSKIRIQLYQLYYYLVHLNLFGVSYAGAVRRGLNLFLN